MKTIEVTGMNANNVSKVVSGLSMLLANLQVHYTNLRNLHWNVKGKGFFVLHEKYEELYNDVAGKIDEVAERMLQLDATPEHRFSVYLKQAQVAEIDVVSYGKQGLGYVIDVLKVLIAQEREILSSASQAGDEVTVSMMSDYLKEQEKLAWMLAAWSTQHE